MMLQLLDRKNLRVYLTADWRYAYIGAFWYTEDVGKNVQLTQVFLCPIPFVQILIQKGGYSKR